MRLLVYILTIGIFLISPQVRGQDINSYNVNATLNVDSNSLEINQIMKFKNTSNIELKEIFLEDWSNSYINNETKLAKRISDEYSRSFSFAKKRQRGFTTINNLEGENIKSWYRYNNQLDIIKVELIESIKKDQSITIELNYTIKLPDSKFTGHGYDGEDFYLKNWLIIFSNLSDDKWSKQSNLNLDDQTLSKSRFNINFSFEGNYNLISNLNKKKVNSLSQIKTIELSGSSIDNVRVYLIKEDNYNTLQNQKIDNF